MRTIPGRGSATWLLAGVVAATLAVRPIAVRGQGVTTGGIRGAVSATTPQRPDARVRVTHDATGVSTEVRATAGRFLVQGLEPGGPYSIEVRAIGFAPQRQQRVFIGLGELREIEFVLEPLATRLDTVAVAGTVNARAAGDGGTAASINAQMLDRFPTLTRDLYDFVRLVPQISTKISLPNAGLSVGGVGFRFNNFLINGVSERTLSGNVSNAFAGVKSIPLGALQEYQVLLAPYDVRYGDFSGALVNAVTKSGSNTFQGSVFAYGRSDGIARRAAGDSSPPYERIQYGLSLGGPIIRNRLHFFVAPELQKFTYPADGPYVGQPTNATRPVPVSADDVERFTTLMRGYGLTAGSPGAIENGNPLRNLYARLDLALPEWRSRLIAWNNYSGSKTLDFSRAESGEFSLSSFQMTRVQLARASALHLHTTLPRAGGGHNELLLSQRADRSYSSGKVNQPVVRVSVPSLAGGEVALNAGTHPDAQGSRFRASSIGLKDNLALPFGASHVVTLGAEVERFGIERDVVNGSYGEWTFASLADFERGVPERYEVGIPAPSARVPIRGMQYAAYAGDQWRVSDRVSLTGGLRADLLAIEGRAPYHSAVDSIFGRRTDAMPRHRVELSPRLGFTWDVAGTGAHLVRGGAGIFTGRYPLAWPHAALSNYGVGGGGQLICTLGGSTDRYPPPFTTDHTATPTACGGGYTIPTSRGEVNLLDPWLRMMRVARASVAYDRRLPWNVGLTTEALITRGLSDFVFVNLNLQEPLASDPNGRVMYGSIDTLARASRQARSTFPDVMDLRNTPRNYAYQFSMRLEKTHSSGSSGFASYTFSRARDVQTPLRVNNPGRVTWGSARATGGRHDDMSVGISANDIPHRVIFAGTYVAPWRQARSELTFYYVGESGRPFTYLAFGAGGRGDLNADGSNANDPIYVPRNTRDTLEIRFSGLSDSTNADASPAAQADRIRRQQDAFERFVSSRSCLRDQRGRILARNSCREPWSHTTVGSVRQEIPIGTRGLEIQLDVFNVLNVLNGDWGLRQEAATGLFEHVQQTAGSPATSQPVFRFDPNDGQWIPRAGDSAYQLQLALRYRF